MTSAVASRTPPAARMRLGDQAIRIDGPSAGRRGRVLAAAITVGTFGLVAAATIALAPAPVAHLFYVPILVAGIRLGWGAALATGIGAAVVYHFVDPALVDFAHVEACAVQLLAFPAVGLVAARVARDAREMRRLAATDDLTGLLNLRAFESAARDRIETARATGTPIAFLSLDVDRLKSLNDAFGHLTGADAVRTVGHVIGRVLPPDASACRFGGDEFVLVVSRCDEARAAALAKQIERALVVEAPVLDGRAFATGSLSVSVGSAARRIGPAEPTLEAFRDLLADADTTMYLAKRARHASMPLRV
jgi:diguanylate cyclase (GGDEF)-like protein